MSAEKRLVRGDIDEKSDGAIEQKEHGSMDATLVPKGKDHPELPPYEPEHDHKDPDVEPDVDSSAAGALGTNP
jgi:hypothetical protein